MLPDILHVREDDGGVLLTRIVQIEGVSGQKYQIAIDIFGDGRAMSGHETVKTLTVWPGDPTRQLKLGNVPVHFQSVLVGEAYPQHIELQRTDHADQGG